MLRSATSRAVVGGRSVALLGSSGPLPLVPSGLLPPLFWRWRSPRSSSSEPGCSRRRRPPRTSSSPATSTCRSEAPSLRDTGSQSSRRHAAARVSDYGKLVAKHFHLHLIDASCGTAVIDNVLTTPQGSNPPQLSFVTPATKLITVAVGGNDIVYNGTAVECDNAATTCALPTNFAALVATMRTNLKVMIEKIRAAAPSATIVFVTYPREVPPGNCPALGFTNSAAAIVRSMGQTLENAFVQVVKRSGRDLCRPLRRPGGSHRVRTPITTMDPGLQVHVRRHRLCSPPDGARAQGDGPNDYQCPRRAVIRTRPVLPAKAVEL